MKISTWNINSVRLRLPLLQNFINEHAPDIICLQETKTPDEFFPYDPLKEMGYQHIYHKGMKGYNGVAVISRIPFTGHDEHMRCGNDDCRHITAHFKGFEVHNLYIPAGGYEPYPKTNDKFQHKLDFVDEMTAWFSDNCDPQKPVIAVGDFNIAPMENDVWSHKQMLKVVSHTPMETARLNAMQESLNWVDVTRHLVPEDKKAYTWWSYRNKDWKKSNRGRRLDHIWVTQPLKSSIKSQEILREARDWERPSDHVPLIVELDI